jgi:hypothetical protein
VGESAEFEKQMDANPWYNGNKFKKMNVEFFDVLRNAFSEISLFDIYLPTAMRPDRHPGGIDCLHYCIPGPISFWADYLAAILSMHARTSASGLAASAYRIPRA